MSVPLPTRAPGPRGLDHLEAMQRAARYPNDAVVHLHERYGDAFRFGFGPIRYTWFVGPDAARTILAKERDAFEQRRAYVFLQPVGGPEALIASEGEPHRQRRKAVQPAFHARHHDAWIDAAVEAAQAFVRERRGRGTFDVHAEGRRLLLRLVADILLGPRVRHDAPGLLDDLETMMGFTNLPMAVQLVRVPLPGTPFGRFAAARARVDAAVYDALRDARRQTERHDRDEGEPTERPGSLGAALAGIVDLDAAPRVQRDQAVGLIGAAFDTSAAALAWAVQMALEHPDFAEAVAREVRAVGLGSAASPRSAPHMTAFINETMRIFPPASALLRTATRDVDVEGTRLRRGERVAFSVYLTHRDPRLWRDPLRFDPERFAGTAPSPFAFLPFGYGARYCVGAPLAKALVATVLGALLTEARLERVDRERPAEWGTTLQPKGGVRIRLR